MIPEPFSVLTIHPPGCLAEPGFLPGIFHRLEQILGRMEGIDMIKIGIDKDELAVILTNLYLPHLYNTPAYQAAAGPRADYR